jgi:hypothetical protein
MGLEKPPSLNNQIARNLLRAELFLSYTNYISSGRKSWFENAFISACAEILQNHIHWRMTQRK